jgi:predicted DNA-binding transcriptional regulator AlpA
MMGIGRSTVYEMIYRGEIPYVVRLRPEQTMIRIWRDGFLQWLVDRAKRNGPQSEDE